MMGFPSVISNYGRIITWGHITRIISNNNLLYICSVLVRAEISFIPDALRNNQENSKNEAYGKHREEYLTVSLTALDQCADSINIFAYRRIP